MINTLHALHAIKHGLVPWARRTSRQAAPLAAAVWGVGLLLGGSPAALAQTCNQTVNFNYSSVADGTRQTVGSSDKLSAGTPGTSVAYTNYTATTPATTNTFAVGANAALANTGKFLVWQRNVIGGGPTSDVASVVFEFSRPVSNLTLTLTDIDRDITAGTNDFIDRLTFDAYATAVGGTAIDLQPANISGPGLNIKNKFVGTGSGATATSDPALKLNAITGIAANVSTTTGDVTVSFPSPVQRVVITYENIAPFIATTTDRNHTMGFANITFCAQADVYANFTAGPATALPGASASYTAQFGNNGPDNSEATPRSVIIPSGATLTNSGGGTLTGNVLSFGTVASAAGSSASFTYAYTLPTTPGVYFAATTATTSTSASENGLTANNTATQATAVTPVTDLLTTIAGPAAVTQGDLLTLNVTTTNNGPASSANVGQTVQLPTGLTSVFVSNNGTYSSTSGLVTFPALSTLGAGQTVANTISFAAPTTAFAPAATVTPNTTGTGDSNPANNTAYLNGATAATNVAINPVSSSAKVANLFTTISASAPTVSPGASITLSVVAANAGPAPVNNVVETVQLLPGFTTSTLQVGGQTGTLNGSVITFASGATYNTQTGLLRLAAISSLASGASQSYSIQLTAPANGSGQLLATAAVGATSTDATLVTTDPVPADNVAATSVTLLPVADLVAAISGPSSVTLGQAVAYTVTFTNNGPAAAAGLLPTVQLPAGLGASSVTLSEGTYNNATGVVTFPAVASSLVGTSQLYTVSFTPPAVGSYPATAAISSSTPDGVSANNSASTTTSVTPAADLTVQIAGPANAAAGGVVTYVAQTTNNGPSVAASATTTIQLPRLTTTVTTNGSYDAGTGLVTFTNTNLASGAVASNYATFINPNNAGVALVGTAAVTGTMPDPNTANNTSTVNTNTIASNGAADISTAFGATTPSVAPGGVISLVVNYVGSANAVADVVERLYLPPGTVVTSAIPAGATYVQATGVYTLPGTGFARTNGRNIDNRSYTITLTAPASGPFRAVSAVSSSNAETGTSVNNVAVANVTITTPTPSTVYDIVTSISGPAAALPGALITYTVQALNNGPGTATSLVLQTVRLPAGVTATNISGGGVQNGDLITFQTIANQAPGAAGELRNTFDVVMPAAGSLVITASVASNNESNPANNTASVTTSQANQAPVVASVVNAVQAYAGNTAGQLFISSLLAQDADGSVASFQLTSLPNPTTQGVLYYDNGGIYTAITSASQGLTPRQAQTLRFDPAADFVGNVFFTYTATDNAGAVSRPALYSIAVGQDSNSRYVVFVKGGANPYQDGDVVASVFDVNGGKFTSAGFVDPAPDGNGVATASLPATGPAANPSNALPAGIAFDPASGQFTVADRTLLRGGTVSLRITTLDLFGGMNTQDIMLTTGASPLPVELTAFVAQAIRQDAVLRWTTASEKNNDHFVIERSLDGTAYTQVGRVAGQGSKSGPTSYALTDAGIGAKASGSVYYRLRQMDQDGRSTYSPVRVVSFGQAAALLAIRLYPVPVPSGAPATLDLTGLPASRPYTVLLTDLSGRRAGQYVLQGGQLQPLAVGQLAAGSYVLTLTGTDAQGQALRLVKRFTKE
ncbi:beta strand repeat-containing protein [uncultured Hymenobacter sp.]|uniref:beta strand repeat-containing protein n=1 Tax=uncultured Hymenobacter sp. TaxID=170016 RepID=UPI0035CC5166